MNQIHRNGNNHLCVITDNNFFYYGIEKIIETYLNDGKPVTVHRYLNHQRELALQDMCNGFSTEEDHLVVIGGLPILNYLYKKSRRQFISMTPGECTQQKLYQLLVEGRQTVTAPSV